MCGNIYFIKDVEDLTNRNRLTLRRWWNKGKFPKPILFAGNRLAWKPEIINEWINNQFKNENIKNEQYAETS